VPTNPLLLLEAVMLLVLVEEEAVTQPPPASRLLCRGLNPLSPDPHPLQQLRPGAGMKMSPIFLRHHQRPREARGGRVTRSSWLMAHLVEMAPVVGKRLLR
jgi:hypothetical protein